MTVNLTELAEVRAKMTPSEYRHSAHEGVIESPTAGPTSFISKQICEMCTGNADANAAGFVATHNAADVLIEVALAALERDASSKALDDAAHVRNTTTLKAAKTRHRTALAAYRISLAKVTL